MSDIDTLRYVVLDPALHGGAHLIILSDFKFWADHWNELVVWCDEYEAKFDGIVVEFANDETYILFKLRWA